MGIEINNGLDGTIAECKPGNLQKDKMNLVLNTVSESILLLSKDMIVELANEAACKFFNQSPSHVIGKHCTELYGNQITSCGDNYHNCPNMECGKIQSSHTSKYESPNGKMWLKTCYPVMDSVGRIVNYVQTFQNITKQVRAEKEKENIKSQLIKSHKLEAIGKLAGGIAHDFNNIMSVIIGFSNLIELENKVDNITMDYIDEIQKAGNRAAELTNQLMAFSRKQILKPELLDLNSLVLDSEKMLRVLLPENIISTSNLYRPLNKVQGDQGQIVQVLMNLVINARDAMPHGGKILIETINRHLDELSCKFHPEIIPGDYVMLTVSDTGCGIAPKIMAKIFEPFFTTKGVGKGTGLGLSTIYRIIKQSRGYIYAYSELNYGTTFKIYLPDASGKDCNEKKIIRSHMALSGSERILLVEDDKSLRKVIRKILYRFGYNVYEAASGEDAIRLYNKQKVMGINLLISDIIMPGMNGRELAEILLKENPDIKILYISGYTNGIIAQHGVLDDDIAFLSKPFSIRDIASKVRSIMDK